MQFGWLIYDRTLTNINRIDPNLAVAARVVFPQSGRSRPEKRPFFLIFSTFFQKRTYQRVSTGYRGPIYQIKGLEMPFQTQKKLFCFDK